MRKSGSKEEGTAKGTSLARPSRGMKGDASGKGTDRQFVASLARGLELLRAFKPGEDALSNSELARRTGLARPTVTRFAHTLTVLGYFELTNTGYRLSPAVLTLGYPVLATLGIREIAGRQMQALANDAAGTVALGTRVGSEIVFIHRCIGPVPVGLRLDIGSAIPLTTTAMGQAWIAGAEEHERAEIIALLPKLYPRDAPRIKAAIVKNLALYKAKGFCISLGGWHADVSAVGVPLRVPGSGELLAFNCGGPSYRMSRDLFVNDLGPRLVALANEVRRTMEVGRGT